MNKRRRQKSRKNKVISAGAFIKPIIIGFIFVLVLSFVTSLYFSQEEKFQQQAERKEELTAIKQKGLAIKEELEDSLENFHSPENIEKLAREEFGFVRADELLFGD